MRILRIGRPAVVAACVLSLAACGGGGGGSSPSTEQAPQQTLVGISASNYQAVSQAVVSGALFLGDTSELLTGAQASTPPHVLRHAIDGARRGLAFASGRPVLLTGVEVREVVNCSQGGKITMSLNDGNGNGTLDAGDSITMDLQSCKEEGSTMEGRLSISLQSVIGVYGSNNYSSTMTLTMTSFNVITGLDSSQGDGALTLTLSQTPAGVGEVTLTTPRLTTSERVAGQTFSTTMSGTRLAVRSETVGGTFRSSINFTSTLASNSFGSLQVTITTPQPLVITGDAAYPSSGQLLVRGHANSAVRITALNTTQARLELDADGDGTYETQTTKTWAELQ